VIGGFSVKSRNQYILNSVHLDFSNFVLKVLCLFGKWSFEKEHWSLADNSGWLPHIAFIYFNLVGYDLY